MTSHKVAGPGKEVKAEPGAVVRVPFPFPFPFPYTNAETRQHRPALVMAATGPGAPPFLLWVLMITSAENRGWPGDVTNPDAAAAGLPAASVVRTAKIATIDAARAEPRGRVETATLAAVRAKAAARLGPEPP